MRLLLPRFNAAPDGFHRGAVAVLAQVLVGIAGTEESVGHSLFVNPAARNHSSKPQCDGIERLVTFADRGGTEFGDGTIERCCSISLAARAVGCANSVGES